MKRPPKVTVENINRVISDVYDQLTQITESLHGKPLKGRSKPTSGDPGDIRLVQGNDGGHYLEMRFGDTWVTSAQGAFAPVTRRGTRPTATIPSTGVVPGTYPTANVTVNSEGRVVNIEEGVGGGGGTEDHYRAGIVTIPSAGIVTIDFGTPVAYSYIIARCDLLQANGFVRNLAPLAANYTNSGFDIPSYSGGEVTYVILKEKP